MEEMDIDAPLQIPLPIPNAALSYLMYDEYRWGDEVHVDEVISLDEFVLLYHMVDRSNTHMRADEYGLVYFPGETDHHLNLSIAADKAKKASWSVVDALAQNEKHGLCFGPFGWDNVFISKRTGKVKFSGVELISGLDQNELEQRLWMNYLDGAAVIFHMFGGDVPDDIYDLLNLMQLNFKDRELFPVHASLVPMVNHSTLFKEVFDTVMLVVSVADQHGILLGLRAEFPDYMQHWRAVVAGNDLLNETLTFNGGKIYIALPNQPNPNQQKLSQEERSLLVHLRIDPSGKKFLDQRELDLAEPLQLLLFLRNRPAHRMERYQKFLLTHADEDFNSLGSERVSHGRFSLIMVFLQWELYSRGYIWRIQALPMFCILSQVRFMLRSTVPEGFALENPCSFDLERCLPVISLSLNLDSCNGSICYVCL